MFKIDIKKPKSKHGPIKVYARVQRDRGSDEHLVIYLRTPGMKRWICDCEDFMFRKMARRKVCEHIKSVRDASNGSKLRVGDTVKVLDSVYVSATVRGREGKIISVNTCEVCVQFPDWNNGHTGTTGDPKANNCWFIVPENLKKVRP